MSDEYGHDEFDAVDEETGEVGPTEASLATAQQAEEEGPQLVFQNVDEWVNGFLIPHFRRSPKMRWDPRWWEYAEVVSRLTALWRAWEQMRLEGMTGMATYWLNIFDPMMAEITSPDGPFWKIDKYADAAKRELPDAWASERPPAAFFL